MSDSSEETIQMLDDCRARVGRLTDWEILFCVNLRQAVDAGRMPTRKQAETLDEIWERVTAHGASR